MKRFFDIFFSLTLLVLLAIPILLIFLLIKFDSKGPGFHYSKRIGKNNKIFYMLKFRTMIIKTPQVATHLLSNPSNYLTIMGKFLRQTSLDELPQLWNILKNDMSFIGPRPALFNQYDLIELRTQKGIHKLTPGLTGWAQINGRDNIPISQKVTYDLHYLLNKSIFLDLKILFLTFLKVIKKENVSH